jgi:hypothetical protein
VIRSLRWLAASALAGVAWLVVIVATNPTATVFTAGTLAVAIAIFAAVVVTT